MEAIGEDRWRAMRSLLRDTTRLVRHRTVDEPAATPWRKLKRRSP
jgi:hypothetical protein